MKKAIFLEQLEKNTQSEILFLSIKRMIDKIYDENQEFSEDEIKEFFSNYTNYHKYLNDYAGVIYNRYGSHINEIYIQMCEYLKIDIDNKYTLGHVITKLEKQTPELLLHLTNEEIQEQTIEHFDEKLQDIEGSSYYIAHKELFEPRVKKLYTNIELVKRALNRS